jgi:hypothetical protein
MASSDRRQVQQKTGRSRVRRGLVLSVALLAGGALALPFASLARTSARATSTETTGTGTTATTGTTGSTGTTGTTGTTTVATTPKPTPKPPRAYTAYAEQITTTSAVLRARIDPEGLTTDYWFQYGPTAAYGLQTSMAAAGNGTVELKLTHPVTGLQAGTVYHFRVVARNAAGTTAGVDATFTTKKLPLRLAISVTPSQVVYGAPLRLSGTLIGTGNAGAEVVVQADPFPYGGFHNITSPEPTDAAGDFSFPIAGLVASATLRVVTVNAPIVYSAPIHEPVTVRVTLHVRASARRGYARLYGTVTPAEPGARVAFERYAHGRYMTVSGTVVRVRAGVARFTRTVRTSHGRYRALVQVERQGLVSGRSRPVLIH